ncbi:hypothetical protein GE09DRAFT_1069144 [Coniochaeta sp. 2T2.1]|nr:hypothetical protein GE09DRAFT_1069144 [Coniochaeta sp. 2T2.1]
MDRGSVQDVLRCPRCSKPFDKHATLRRHGYYCRSKQAKSSSRPRACQSCAKRKSRCDGNRPSCSRCLVNSLDCSYPGASATHDKGPEVTPPDEAHTSQCNWDTQLAASPPSAGHGRVWQRQYSVPKDIMSTPAPGPPTLEAAEFPWNTTDADFANYLVPQVYQYNTSPSVDLVDQSGFLAGQPVQSLEGSTSFNLHMPPGMSQNMRSFVHRPRQKTEGMGIANIILQTLKSYPVMLSLGGTLPPFIHSHVRSWDSNVASIEPLEDCIGMMQMANTNVSGGRKLFWKVVRMECERLCEEILGLNKRTLLAAMQALFIYIVVRVDEGPTEHNNIDQLLVKTVIVLSQQFNYGTDTGYDDQNLDGKWNKWIFEESVRRYSSY